MGNRLVVSRNRLDLCQNETSRLLLAAFLSVFFNWMM